jgi:hypothetical protein
MASRILCTLDPHRCNAGLLLSQGNRVVTTNAIETYNRMVFGTLAMASGQLAFECYFWSTSRPTGGLTDLCSVGLAVVNADYNSNYCGQAAPIGGVIQSAGLRPSDGTGSDTGAGLYTNDTLVGSAFQSVEERTCIGVLYDALGATPIVAFHVNGSYVGQISLTAGKFYVPAVSIGSSAAAGDVSAYLNFGQNRFDFPNMTVNK